MHEAHTSPTPMCLWPDRLTSRQRHILVVLLALSALFGTPTTLQGSDEGLYGITPTLGYRGGGQLEEADSETRRHVDSARSYGLTLNLREDVGRWYELYASRQDTHIRDGGPSLRVDHLHLGGKIDWRHSAFSHFLAGGVGISRLQARGNGSGSDLRPALSLALGVEIPLAGPLHLRMEGRGLITLTGDDRRVFCIVSGEQSGCVFGYRGNAFTQIEASAGLSMRF